jgi:hypothetical protein
MAAKIIDVVVALRDMDNGYLSGAPDSTVRVPQGSRGFVVEKSTPDTHTGFDMKVDFRDYGTWWVKSGVDVLPVIRQRTENSFFTFLKVGIHSGSPVHQADKVPYVAIPHSNEFVSICTEDGCAVLYNVDDMRGLALALLEAATVFEDNKGKKVKQS